MSYTTLFYEKEKKPPWPLGVDVDVHLSCWKYPKRGRIKETENGNYCFFYTDSKYKETFRQLSLGTNRFDVTVVETGIKWDPYENKPK